MSDGEVYKGSRKPHVFEASHTRNRGSLRDRIGQGNGAEDMQDTREELAEMETTRRPEDNFVFNFFSALSIPRKSCVLAGRWGGGECAGAHIRREKSTCERIRTNEKPTHTRTHETDCRMLYLGTIRETHIYIYYTDF